MQANQVTVDHAVAESPRVAEELAALAAAHRASHAAIDQSQTLRFWVPDARCFCYQTHICISGQPRARLDWLGKVLYAGHSLERQPWYPQFKGGKCQAHALAPATGVNEHQLSWGCFDLGLPAPRYYRQLVSLAETDANTRIVVARSVLDGPALPEKATLAYTLNPNGEVLHWENGQLHWHHICCTPGAALLPPLADRLLINALRGLHLDQAERKTYRGEAQQMRDWLQHGQPEHDIEQQMALCPSAG